MTTEQFCYDKTCKSRNINTNLSLIFILWSDAAHQEGPSFIGNIKPDYILKTGGFLVKETESHYSVALDFYEEEGTWRHITTIPKGMVLKTLLFPVIQEPEENAT